MRITELAIKRPAMMTMVVLFFVVLGLYSYRSIGVDLYPALNTPYITVVTSYPGAGAEEIETQIIKPIEEGLSSLAKLKKLTSVATEGVANVVLEFELTANADQAAMDVQKKIDAIRGRLPKDAKDPVVVKRDMGAIPVMALALSSERPLHETYDLATDFVKERLQKVSGVSEVTVTGGQKREVSINIDRSKLEMYGVSINQVINRLAAENLNQPSGRLDRPEAEYMVRVLGEFRSIEEIKNLEVQLNGGGTVALRQLATVVDGYKEIREYSRINGGDAVALLVFKQSDASMVTVGEQVAKEIDRIRAELPLDTQLVVARDLSNYIRLSLNGTRSGIIEGIISTALALLFFLRDWRSMLTVLIAIPTSLITTLAGMYFAGFTFNMMSLMGMALCIGILVDDSIVVLENIHRHLKMGKDPAQAAIDGRSEIGMAAIAITASDIVVFAPIAFMGGMVGQFFRQFGLTVVFAALMSLFVSFTLTPMLAARLFKQNSGQEKLHPLQGRSWRTAFHLGLKRFWVPVDWFAQRFRSAYSKTLVWALSHRKTVLATAIAAFVLSILLIPLQFVGIEFAPRSDQGEMTVALELPIGTPIQKTDQALMELEAYLKTIPEVKFFQTTLGSTGGFGISTTGSHIGRIGISLKNKAERKRSIWQVAEDIRIWSKDFSSGKITVTESDSMAGGGAPVQLEVAGPDPKILVAVADQIKNVMMHTPGSRDVDSNWRIGQPEIQVQIDRLRAASMGISVTDVAKTLRASLSGEAATVYRQGDKEIDTVVRLSGLNKSDLDSLRTITLTTAAGTNVQLQQVADITVGAGPTEIRRADRQRAITLSSNLQNRTLNEFTEEVDKQIKATGLPAGYSYKFVGQTQSMKDSFIELIAALLLSILLVYMVLVMLYESYMTPFIRMIALPLGIVGALTALAVTKNSLNLFSMIGIIMMDGLVAKNGTLLIDYANTLMERGRTLREALAEAGQTRLRPIVMTTMTMIFGMLPSALALTEGSEMRSSMAWVLIGGLITSTLFTLIVIPVVYTLMDDAKNWILRRWRRLKVKAEDGVVA